MPGVMLAVAGGQAAYTVPSSATVTSASNPPKLPTWLGVAASEPGTTVVVVAFGAAGTVVRAVSASSRGGWSLNASVGSSTGALYLRPPSVDTTSDVMFGAALGGGAVRG